MTDPLYSIKDLERRYGHRLALQVDRLELERGRTYAITGPNGSGKSTLLRILAFLDRPTRGEVFFEGRRADPSLSNLSLRRRVTLVHQNPYLLRGTVFENVAYGLRARRARPWEVTPRAEAALRAVGLLDLARQKAWLLSGGEAQRLAMARALVVEPEVLLLDEPTANVDPTQVESLISLIYRLREQRGTTVIFTSHQASPTRRLADHRLHLLGGRLVGGSQGTRLVGTMRVHEGTCVFLIGGVACGEALERAPRGEHGTVDAGPEGGGLSLQGRVTQVGKRGEVVVLRLASDPAVEVHLSLALYGDLGIDLDDPINLVIDAEATEGSSVRLA